MTGSGSLDQLRNLVARLRQDCPWDRRQTRASMRAYFIEEFHEALDALDRGEPGAIQEELGDLLFQIFFHARLEEEAGRSDIDAVAAGTTQKMIKRHPHVFGDLAGDPAAGNAGAPAGGPAAWEARKAAALAAGASRLDSIPASLPALLRAHKVGKKMANVGFDWPDIRGVFDKLDEERRELDEAIASGDPAAIAQEYGDLLLTMASLGRHLDVCGEDALREANARFEGRFRRVESLAAAAGVTMEEAGLERLEAFYQQAKQQAKQQAQQVNRQEPEKT